MIHYTTERAYQTIHWMNGSIKRQLEVLNEIYSLLNISLKNTKSDSFPKKLRRKTQQSPNCALFISGFPNLSRNQKLIEALGNALDKNGHVCFIIRDKTDDPEFFNEIKVFGGLVFVPDYTVVSVKTIEKEPKNILCVGGDITIDRKWKTKQNGLKKLFNRNIYFENERPVYNEDAIKEIIETPDLKLDMIASIIPISYVGDDPYFDKVKWFDEDPDLKKDVISSREVMDKILLRLRNENKEPSIWCHCQLNHDTENDVMGVKFISDDTYKNYNNLIISFNSFDKNKKKNVSLTNNYIQNMIDEETAMEGNHHRRGNNMGLHFNPMHVNPVWEVHALDGVEETIGDDNEGIEEETNPELQTNPWDDVNIAVANNGEPQNREYRVQIPESLYRLNYEDLVNNINHEQLNGYDEGRLLGTYTINASPIVTTDSITTAASTIATANYFDSTAANTI